MPNVREVLVTGGMGYIGSHTCVELITQGYDVVILDNLCNSSVAVLERIRKITGKRPKFVLADVRDKGQLHDVFAKFGFAAVLHFAGLKSVGEATANPLHYYQNNVAGTLNLLEVMSEFGCKKFIFSSSATVYGDVDDGPIREDAPTRPTNPYGQSKLQVEHILTDLKGADSDWKISILRYFNPVGAHDSGLIGEDPAGCPNNLMPFISQVAVGRRDRLKVFGDDYPTPDGTGVRDYIHVVDLARGHVSALNRLEEKGFFTLNLGTGMGYSVLELVKGFEKVSGRTIPYEITGRRPGDVAISYADPALAYELLGWKAEYGLQEMCKDTWRWQSLNPHGFQAESTLESVKEYIQ